ncbi:MAG: hypothetical protein Ct9H300mP4_13480 [Gammaproteobacteria bacterium]|nr:MAG: hypothetical protein Ct9H300mP4_13480 [Gammaproteobacteria bacterium]
MTLSKPKKAWFYAGMTLLGSVLGAVLVSPLVFLLSIMHWNYLLPWDSINLCRSYGMVCIWGVGVVFVAGISIVPYWLFTITAGAMDLNFVFFFHGSISIERLRFYCRLGCLLWGRKGCPLFEKILIGWVGRF